ncbi:metal dependent phosphohydrolase [Paracidovorax avenae ATCC 19860]|uniref:Metal dependent phosphohydrolase n=1 Tax=Paracidovorax avenae (strain ATCC 19860 / DSM 7227 / CCUG 15838 / JCM 20985 / LMG 2117 / NCPPB 1011) TaxID=643561 RepID=F0Q3W6_PARA1|nr:HD-GYP domain-containing protein [Paracidovorax avenae]ADX45494.1 metal dependent phosphohydrolase [Paracidovorax avenae ATCC 19860]
MVSNERRYAPLLFRDLPVNSSLLIDVALLRVGMYIQLELGWMNHPFPVSSFRIASGDQIATLQSLGLEQVRWVPGRSDAAVRAAMEAPASAPPGSAEPAPMSGAGSGTPSGAEPAGVLHARLEAQRRALARCDEQFARATRVYERLALHVEQDPAEARKATESLVRGCVDELMAHGDSAVRLLSERAGTRAALHSVNVAVLSLLLGKSLGMRGDDLGDLGIAALLHDLGKISLPPHVAQPSAALGPADQALYEAHVGESVVLAQRMGLGRAVVSAIAQHHERADGGGFPLGLRGTDLGRAGQVLALVNHYDRLCNPLRGAAPLTPHEALSVLFAQHKSRFDAQVLQCFIRLMGVYPAGSIVQLTNERYAIVVAVDSARPLRPQVIVHDGSVPRDEALVLDLERSPDLGIRRSLRPAQLPRDALDYLSPRKRICYFFERALVAGPDEVPQ